MIAIVGIIRPELMRVSVSVILPFDRIPISERQAQYQDTPF